MQSYVLPYNRKLKQTIKSDESRRRSRKAPASCKKGRLNLDSRQQQALFVDFIVRMKKKGITQKQKKAFYNAMFNDPYLNALRCVFGYAITCHKSQGGEWEEVYVHVPRNITLNPTKETYQWVYTSMTRARKTLHMIDDFYIK